MIDWDGLAADAETTPSVILANIMGRIDDVEDVLVITRFRNSAWRFDYSGQVIGAIGLGTAGLDFLIRELRIANEADD